MAPSRGHALRWIFGALTACVCVTIVAFMVSPWPGVLVIRAIFDQGAATASRALEKHIPANLAVQEAIRYDAADPTALFDVYQPRKAGHARPTIVWIHGGGFVSGRRGDVSNYLKVLAGRGFNVINVDYTIAPSGTYPKPVAQVAKALAFADANADRLNINKNAIVLGGDSAGAQIAAQLAGLITASAYAREVGIAPPLKPSQLIGALLFCGIYDLSELRTDDPGLLGWFLRTVTWAYSGQRDWRNAPGFAHMSVARHVTSAFPPAFISAGNADPLLPQSVMLERALRAHNVAVDGLFFPSGHTPPLPHEYQFNLDQPAGRLALDRSVRWLEGLQAR